MKRLSWHPIIALLVSVVIGLAVSNHSIAKEGKLNVETPRDTVDQEFNRRQEMLNGQIESFGNLAELLRGKLSGRSKNDGDGNNTGGGDNTFIILIKKEEKEDESSKPERSTTESKPAQETPPSISLTPTQATAIEKVLAENKFKIEAYAMASRQAGQSMIEARQVEATNPAYARRLRQIARRKLDDALGFVEDLSNTIASAVDPSGAPPPSPRLIGDQVNPDKFCGIACEQLKRIAAPAGGAGLPRFDTTAPRSSEDKKLQPIDQRLFKGMGPRSPPPLSGRGPSAAPVLNDSPVPLDGLRDAVANTAPQLADMALFVPCTDNRQACTSPQLLELLGSPEKRQALRDVGGVALDVTFDLLAMAGLGEFEGGGDLSFVGQPVLVSLNRLHDHVASYASQHRWSELPASLRFPGGIERLIGFVLDPVGKDVVLVGRKAQRPSHALDIDMIVLAIRQAWKKGWLMGVSLDPLPDDIAGPQYPRVINVPADSIAARVMLDADYAMKLIMFNAGFARGENLIDLEAAYGRSVEGGLARFWLAPRPLGPGSTRLSASRRTMLLVTGVEVRTEEQLVANGTKLGTGHRSQWALHVADAFNDAYPAIELARHVEPKGVFVRLHGLIDLVTFAKIWRINGLDYPVLNKIAVLPYRRLTGKDAIPSFYPGVHSVIPVSGVEGVLIGGVDLSLRWRGGMGSRHADHVMAMLERAVDEYRTQMDIFHQVAIPVAVPRIFDDHETEVDRKLLTAGRLLAQNKFDRATKGLIDLVQQEPLVAEAWSMLATAYLHNKKFERAASAVLHAIELNPGDEHLRLLAKDILWSTNARTAYATFSPDERRQMSAHYAALARSELLRKRNVRGKQFAEWAVQLSGENGDAHLLLAFARASTDQKTGRRDMVRAIRAYRRQHAAGIPNAGRKLSIALSISAAQRVERAFEKLFDRLGGWRGEAEVDVGPIVYDLDAAHKEAREAGELDPDQPLAMSIEPLAMALSATVAPDKPSAVKHAIQQIKKVRARFPDNPIPFEISGRIYMIAENWPSALADLERSIELAPSRGQPYAIRAIAFAQTGRCTDARGDIQRARNLAGGQFTIPAAVEQFIADCRQRPLG